MVDLPGNVPVAGYLPYVPSGGLIPGASKNALRGIFRGALLSPHRVTFCRGVQYPGRESLQRSR